MSWINSFGVDAFAPDESRQATQHGQHVALDIAATGMPPISEDEAIVASDDPTKSHHDFTKTAPPKPLRRESLLTLGLHTDSESLDESTSATKTHNNRLPSRSSTCSTWSVRSDVTSEDGQTSPVVQPSNSTSPLKFVGMMRRPSASNLPQISKEANPLAQLAKTAASAKAQPTDSSADPAEATLGRKRCISFACGQGVSQVLLPTSQPPAQSKPELAEEKTVDSQSEPLRRITSLRFECPIRAPSGPLQGKDRQIRMVRRSSPAPASRSSRTVKTPSPTNHPRRMHRGSDSTIKLDSPKSIRKAISPVREVHRAKVKNDDATSSEATKFHEFAGSDDEPDDWIQEQTVYKSRLTVDDTLKKENDIRHLAEQAAAEEAADEEDQDALVYGREDDVDEDDEDDDEENEGNVQHRVEMSDDDVSDGGFQTDDEEGFAESDDDSDDGSDYEWWAPRRRHSPKLGTMVPEFDRRNHHTRNATADVYDQSDSSAASPSEATGYMERQSRPVPIQMPMPELPDSTDFVCGTLDEDRPLEEAYMSCMEQRKAAKHRAIPQDIDPTFPPSDPELESEEEVGNGLNGFSPGNGLNKSTLEETTDKSRGRKKVSPRLSPRRHKSPAPPKRTTNNRSPAPAGLRRTASHKSPNAAAQRLPSTSPTARGRSAQTLRGRSPAPRPSVALSPAAHALFGRSPNRSSHHAARSALDSPPPSDANASPPSFRPMTLGTAFLGHRPSLTHTSSLPRSPGPLIRRGSSYFADSTTASQEDNDDEDTAREDHPYSRGAIDIVQGLERKRLRRRQKFYEKYLKKEERKMQRGERHKRPLPGKGAQRMRQIGIENAIYRGKRVLSV